MDKTLLFILRHSPYQSSLAKEAIDAALAGAVFDQKIQLLFTGEGVWQTLDNQRSEQIDSTSIEANLQALPMYDIDDIYVDEASLNKRGLTPSQLALDATIASQSTVQQLIQNSHTILSF